jgi:hypothetical protein
MRRFMICAPHQMPLDGLDRECSIYVEKRNAYTDLVGKHEGKRTLRRPG